LIGGNHDILKPADYQNLQIEFHKEFQKDGVYFCHNLKDNIQKISLYSISGHIHPTFKILGRGKQSVKAPCFWIMNQKNIIMPSFGSFTGGYEIEKSNNDAVYLITKKAIIPFY
jgi:metallophosphoesterase superfamily enzyme